jgi:predicted TIM-barrel fold metal-dependent hydrolase
VNSHHHNHSLIDVHVHSASKQYVDLLAQLGAESEVTRWAREMIAQADEAGLQRRLDVMNRSQVERQILSMSAATPYFDDVESSIRAARFINDEHAELCRRYPDRFSFFATLPMPHVDACLIELDRAMHDLGAVGVTFTTHIRGRSLAEPAFEELFAELDRRGSVVFLHPPGFSCYSPMIQEVQWTLGAPIEDAVCAMQLMRAGFPRRYPQLKIILPHLGGFLAFLRYRTSRNADINMPAEDKPSLQMRKFWYDTASGEPEALRIAAACYGADKLLFGSDYPYWDRDYDVTWQFLEQAGLSPSELAGVRSENARALFGEKLSPVNVLRG